MTDGDLCRLHDPDHAEGAAIARRLGGQHRRREGTIHATYDLPPLESLDWSRRLLEIGAGDLLVQDNSTQRARALFYGAHVGLRVIQLDQIQIRLEALELAMRVRPEAPPGERPELLSGSDAGEDGP